MIFSLLLSAQAAPFHRCTGAVTFDDVEVAVSGHGSDPDIAAERARAAARQAASRLLLGELWPALMMDSQEVIARLLDGAVLDPALGLPGARYVAGGCTGGELPGSSGWTATVAGQSATRSDPGLAISAARRLGCEAAWSQPAQRLFHAVPMAAFETREAMMAQGMQEAREALTACYAAQPNLQSGRGLPDPAVDGTVECASFGVRLADGAVGRGWGSTVEVAADRAAWDRAVSQSTATLGQALDGFARASAETRMMLLAAAVEWSLLPVGPDLGERGLIACQVHPSGGAMAWLPTDIEQMRCADDEDWASFTSAAATLPGSERDAWCQEHASRGADLVSSAIGGASPEMRDVLRQAGWGVVLGCDAACRGGSRLGSAGEPVLLPGITALQPESAAALFGSAVEARDLGSLVLVAPFLIDSRMVGLREHDPDRFWSELAMLAERIDGGAAPESFRWTVHGGHAILLMEN